MPINNNKYVSLVELEETANVEWLYYKCHSAMCYTEVLMQVNRVWCYSRAYHMVEPISWKKVTSSYKVHTYMTPFFPIQQTKDGL